MIACEAGHVEVVELIIDHDPSLLFDCSTERGTPLHSAIVSQKADVIVPLLLECYDELHRTKEMVNKKDESGIHPLFLSCFTGNFELTKLLMESGADPSQSSNNHNVSPLHICAERGFHELAELLLEESPELVF